MKNSHFTSIVTITTWTYSDHQNEGFALQTVIRTNGEVAHKRLTYAEARKLSLMMRYRLKVGTTEYETIIGPSAVTRKTTWSFDLSKYGIEG